MVLLLKYVGGKKDWPLDISPEWFFVSKHKRKIPSMSTHTHEKWQLDHSKLYVEL